MLYKKIKMYSLFRLIIILILIQLIRIVIKQATFELVDKNIFNNDLISLIEMVIFTILILIICKKRNIKLSIFPDIKSKKDKIGYLIATLIFAFLVISNFIFNVHSTGDAIAIIISIIATPIFEELIFRGYVWNELKNCFENEFTIYIISTVLFALWHLGYADSIWFRMTLNGKNTLFPTAMLWKVITGLCFGIVIGFVRYKLKNCYAAILVHSFMNNFGR